MTNVFKLFLLLFGSVIYAQNIKPLEPTTVNKVKEMAVYPGCEKFEGNKRSLITCFGNELSKDILPFLDTEFPDLPISTKRVAVQLEFHVNIAGEIINITAKRGDESFKPQAVEALKRTATFLIKQGKYIKPARLADGNMVTLIFQYNIILNNPEY